MKQELLLRTYILKKDYEAFVATIDSGSISPEIFDDLIIYASQQGLEQFVIFLLSRGAKIDKSLLGGSSLITFAARNNMKNLINYLLSRGGDINHRDEDGLTPLHAAVLKKDAEMIDFLLRAGADAELRFMGDSAASMIEELKLTR